MIKRREFITLLGGAAAAWPVAARAQQRTGKIPRVGFLLNVPSELVDTLFRGLRDAGYIEGQNIILETRFAGNMLDRIDQFATELVALPCDLIFAAGPYSIEALTKATSTIPLVRDRPRKRSSGQPVGRQHRASRRQPHRILSRSS